MVRFTFRAAQAGRDRSERIGAAANSDARVSTLVSVDECKLVELPVVENQQGNLTFIEGRRHVPFPIERVYYLYDVPEGAARGGHAHRVLEQLIIPIGGSFDVVVDDGSESRRITLDRPRIGLYVPRMIWRELENFSAGSFCVVLASAYYDEADYYRNYEEFRAAVTTG
jgi:dTDP-4-dehydrorhamnose 3,5-epimerase-like enzyme